MSDINNRKCHIGWPFLCVLTGCLLSMAFFPLRSLAAPPATAVLYPDIREPYRSVFLDIAKGIGDALDGEIVLQSLSDETTTPEVLGWISHEHVKTVVALGNRGFSMSRELASAVPVVVGAVQMSPEMRNQHYYGIALNADPALLLAQLKQLVPGVRRVTVVYHRQHDAWMIEDAARAARELGLTLNAVAAENLVEAAKKYREILKNQRSETDALWLSQDSGLLDEQAILPMILKQAWNKRLVVFSNNPSHVKRGVLFALYPDNYKMGKSLGKMALKLLNSRNGDQPSPPSGMHALRDLNTAFNIRTAAHLDIPYTVDDLRHYNLIFPAK